MDTLERGTGIAPVPTEDQVHKAFRERRNADNRRWYKKHAEELRRRDRERYRKFMATRRNGWHKNLRGIGFTPELLDWCFEKQGGKCAICKEKHKLFADHDHKTNRPRGLLCSRCNSALGFARDSIQIVDGMKEYLCKPTIP